MTTEVAHAPDDCPYREVETRRLSAQVSVREDRRRCLPSVEERRFSVIRNGSERILGRRRFDPDSFASARYRWQAEVSEADEAVVTVHNEGHGPILFREGTPEELEKGISY